MTQKAIIYVFSGTGNTRYAADRIARALLEQGIATTVWEARVPFSSAPDPNDFDIAGFGYPIHAFNTPRFFLRFIKTLPDAKGRQAFIFKTSGEPFHFNNASSWALVRALRKKGFVPILERHMLMPYNIMFRYNDSLAKQMYLHTRSMAKIVAGRAASGAREKLRYYPWTILCSYIFRLQWFGALINGPMIHVKRDLCKGCGLCVKKCPANNISMEEGYPRFSSRCTMCMGCALRCPQDAVRPGFLNPWRVNGEYHFERLTNDGNIPDKYIKEGTRGYFRLFRRYYRRTYAEIKENEGKEYKKDGIV